MVVLVVVPASVRKAFIRMSATAEQLRGLFGALITVAAGGAVVLILASITGQITAQFPIAPSNPFFNFTRIIQMIVSSLTTYAPVTVTVIIVFTLIMPLILWLWRQYG